MSPWAPSPDVNVDLRERAPDVVSAAWQGSGAPEPAGATGEGPCARCSTIAALVPVRSVVSKVFVGFEGWANTTGHGLCAPCAWGYTTPSLRTAAHLVTRQPVTYRQLDRAGCAALLLQALDPGAAVVVPLRPGRKHVMPRAAWGRITIDDATLPWSAREAGLLHLVLELRAHGFGSRMLQEPHPPYAALVKLPRDRWSAVIATWESLAPWRLPGSPWLPLALHLTTPTN